MIGAELTDDVAAVINGLFGDTLEARNSRFAIPMTIRAGRTVLPLDAQLLRSALSESNQPVNGRISIFVHGLMSNESIWGFPGPAAYPDALVGQHGATALTVRYNTGRRISTNGRELATLLDTLTRIWPVRIREINLIGHSMGGLVVRSACYYGRSVTGRRLSFRRRWTRKVRRVVLIGVPNTGAPLEALVNTVSAALWATPLPAARMVGLGLDKRSAGIKDLRHGAILDEHWQEQPARVERAALLVPPLRRARYLVVAGSVTSDPEHPMARVIGDALVTSSSARGGHATPDTDELFPGATQTMFAGITHNALAKNPTVAEAITGWW